MTDDFVYLVHPELYHLQKEPVFKIGRSKNVLNHIQSYGQETMLIYCAHVSDTIACKKDLKCKLSKDFTPRLDIGLDYYEGNELEIYKCVVGVVANYIYNLKSEDKKSSSSEDDTVQNSPEHACSFRAFLQETLLTRSPCPVPVLQDEYTDFCIRNRLRDKMIFVPDTKSLDSTMRAFGLCAERRLGDHFYNGDNKEYKDQNWIISHSAIK